MRAKPPKMLPGMALWGFTALCMAAVVAPTYGDIEPIVDRLTPNGFGLNNDNNSGQPASEFPPAGLVTLDSYVDVTADDNWLCAGMVVQLRNPLASIEYFLDPNGPVLTAPESAGSPSRHVSFVSQPRPRGANSRFRLGGLANIAGGYDPPTPRPQADPTRLNIAWFDEHQPDYPNDGFVGRATIDVSDLLAAQGLGPDELFLGPGRQSFPMAAEIAFAATTVRDPTLRRIDLTRYAVPESASLALLAVSVLMALRRR